MKFKFFNHVALMMCTVVLSVLMTSCKDKGNEPEPILPNKASAAFMKFDFKAGTETMKVFDFTIDYYDNEGKVQTLVMADTAWTNTAKVAWPCKVGARVRISLKNGVDVNTIDKARIEYSYNYLRYSTNAKDEVLGEVDSKGSESESSIKGEKINAFLAETDHIVQVLYSYDAEGKATSLNTWE